MKQYPGYTLVKREDCPEQHGTLTVLTHDVSGAAVLLVENDDDNKAFGIGFGTFPSDDTGVFHILEHSVLAGSEKYPVKSPFLQLLKSSMASFLGTMIVSVGSQLTGSANVGVGSLIVLFIVGFVLFRVSCRQGETA